MAKVSPLADLHIANGARFGEVQGWSLPLHWGNLLDEYHTVRSHVGLLDLCNRSLVRFTGSDRVPFLQGMVSNDVAKMSPGQGIPAAVANVQGKILADLKVLCTEDAFVLDLIDPLKDKVLDHLNRYLIADDVEIADLSNDYSILSLQGPKATEMLQALLGARDLPSIELGHEPTQIHSAGIRVVRATHTGETGFDLWVPVANLMTLAESLQEKGRPFSVRWIGIEAQDILRIEAGIPRYGIDMDEQHLLLETGLDQAVSFDKGCYLGQETIERIHTRGHVNKRLMGLVMEGKEPPQPGDALEANKKEVGKVTSAVFSPRLDRPIALAYVQRDYLAPGTPLTVRHNNGSIPALVSSLPFKA